MCVFSMSERLKIAFAQRAREYWVHHPQEWRDTWAGRDVWDGRWWTLAVQRLGDGDSFWTWIEREHLDMHLRDQMWRLIKDTELDLFQVYFHHDPPPLQRHRSGP